jgi:hypothetical protein
LNVTRRLEAYGSSAGLVGESGSFPGNIRHVADTSVLQLLTGVG